MLDFDFHNTSGDEWYPARYRSVYISTQSRCSPITLDRNKIITRACFYQVRTIGLPSQGICPIGLFIENEPKTHLYKAQSSLTKIPLERVPY